MGHNVLDSGEDFIDKYLDRDLANHKKKGKPYKVIKDEVFGRLVSIIFQVSNIFCLQTHGSSSGYQGWRNSDGGPPTDLWSYDQCGGPACLSGMLHMPAT